MRIFATLALAFGIFASISVNARAETAETPDVPKLLRGEQIQNVNKNADTQAENFENRISSANGNFIPSVYIPEINSRKIAIFERQRRKIIDYSRLPAGEFIINASAYTAAADECGKSDGITASGRKVSENRTLACPSAYPFGVKLKIDGVGTYVCEDRGGAIKGNHFDIYMKTKSQAFSFGRRNLVAKIVK